MKRKTKTKRPTKNRIALDKAKRDLTRIKRLLEAESGHDISLHPYECPACQRLHDPPFHKYEVTLVIRSQAGLSFFRDMVDWSAAWNMGYGPDVDVHRTEFLTKKITELGPGA